MPCICCLTNPFFFLPTDYPKDLNSYLKYCRDVISVEMTPDSNLRVNRTIDKCWNIYNKNEVISVSFTWSIFSHIFNSMTSWHISSFFFYFQNRKIQSVSLVLRKWGNTILLCKMHHSVNRRGIVKMGFSLIFLEFFFF